MFRCMFVSLVQTAPQHLKKIGAKLGRSFGLLIIMGSMFLSLQAVGGNGAEQTVVSGSMEVLRPCWAVATSGVPVREQLFNASICHHSPFNLFQHGEFARHFGRTQDVSSLEVATPILVPRDDGHRHRKGSHGDVIFLTNRGEVWF